MEMGTAATGRRNRIGNCGLSFPAGYQQVEQDRTPLFSFISQNWRGKPLISHQVIIDLIAATTTTTGLTLKSKIDTNLYEKASGSPISRWRNSNFGEKSFMATGTISSFHELDPVIY